MHIDIACKLWNGSLFPNFELVSYSEFEMSYLVYFAGTKETKIWTWLSVFLIELI